MGSNKIPASRRTQIFPYFWQDIIPDFITPALRLHTSEGLFPKAFLNDREKWLSEEKPAW